MKFLQFMFMLLIPLMYYAQDVKRSEAYDAYKSGDYDKAKKLIDETCYQSETKDHPKTWYFKALIYLELERSKDKNAIDYAPADIAYASIKKSQALDSKHLFVKENHNELLSLSTVFLNNGSSYYNKALSADDKALFEKSLKSFNSFFSVMKDLGSDSVQVINMLAENNMPYVDILVFAGYSAYKAGNNIMAKKYYKRLYNYDDDKLKHDMVGIPYAFITYSSILNDEGKALEAVEVMDKAHRIWPENEDIALARYKFRDDAGLTDVAENGATELEIPNDARAYAKKAMEQDKISRLHYQKGEQEKADKYRESAALYYQKAIDLNPDDNKLKFDLYYNYGVLYYNPAVEIYNKSLEIKGKEARQPYKDKYTDLFNKTIAAFEEAYQIIDTDKDLIDMMTRVYLILEDMDKASEMKEKYKSLD